MQCKYDNLYDAIENDDLDSVKFLMEEAKNIQIINKNQMSIVWASQFGKVEIVKYLLTIPAVNNTKSPICYAAQNGHLEIVKLLLSDSRKILSIDCTNALNWACCQHHTEVVKTLLSSPKVDTCAQQYLVFQNTIDNEQLDLFTLLVEKLSIMKLNILRNLIKDMPPEFSKLVRDTIQNKSGFWCTFTFFGSEAQQNPGNLIKEVENQIKQKVVVMFEIEDQGNSKSLTF